MTMALVPVMSCNIAWRCKSNPPIANSLSLITVTAIDDELAYCGRFLREHNRYYMLVFAVKSARSNGEIRKAIVGMGNHTRHFR